MGYFNDRDERASKPPKLSAVMQAVLEAMAAGATLTYFCGWGHTFKPRYTLQSGDAVTYPTATTLNALLKRGLVEKADKCLPGRAFDYAVTLTDAGRAAIRALQDAIDHDNYTPFPADAPTSDPFDFADDSNDLAFDGEYFAADEA